MSRLRFFGMLVFAILAAAFLSDILRLGPTGGTVAVFLGVAVVVVAVARGAGAGTP